MPDRRVAILDAAIAVIARRGVRGLRVEEVATAAEVAVSLLYYYFENRSGLIRATLDHANERAVQVQARSSAGSNGRGQVEQTLLAELGGSVGTRQTSVVWGEVLASAVFEPDLREHLRAANQAWVDLIAAQIRSGQADGSIPQSSDPVRCAERLTALVDGLSGRWLAGLLTRSDARALLVEAVQAELV